MAGRSTFFSFHYQRDVWRAGIVRNAGQVDAKAAAGWADSSLWEESKKKGDPVIKKLINDALIGTSVTVVLVGQETWLRRWVDYEIRQSVARGNGLLGVYVHSLRDRSGVADRRGIVPVALRGHPVYEYDRLALGAWVEKAAVAAGKPCLPHRMINCGYCR